MATSWGVTRFWKYWKNHPRRVSSRSARLQLEVLESRLALSADLSPYEMVAPAWFQALPKQLERLDLQASTPGVFNAASLHANPAVAQDRWIVRLSERAVRLAQHPSSAADLLMETAPGLRVIRGLGLPGQLLVEGPQSQFALIEAAFQANEDIVYYESDGPVAGQVTTPGDPFYSELIGLDQIDAPLAWDDTTGSHDVIVGVIDSGTDLTHPDLVGNVWINEREIPSTVGAVSDADGDGVLTFSDLNDETNQSFVTNFNPDVNPFIDPTDLLQDPRWADGRDTDGNEFVDDLFGWNFVSENNYPHDDSGHGTRVAGILGAVGDNGQGGVGVNWKISIMSLKFLDEGNQGDTSDAIAAINYATMMRDRFGHNIPLLNNSWGQSGGFSQALRDAIVASGAANTLFVAAAGNGNVLGNGINNDNNPFYPSSYDLDNIIAVSASTSDDALAPFSNYGPQSVDIAAPGVGVFSTTLGGGYGRGNGTSLSTPFVSGAAALIWSRGDFVAAEVRAAVLQSARRAPGTELSIRLASGGILDASQALSSDLFTPRVRLHQAEDIVDAGATTHRVVIEYADHNGLDSTSFDSADIVVRRLWGDSKTMDVELVSIDGPQTGAFGEETYRVAYDVLSPDSDDPRIWDATDFGEYRIEIAEQEIRNNNGLSALPSPIGSFRVQVAHSSVFYVDAFDDTPQSDLSSLTLRDAVRAANQLDEQATIIVPEGMYLIRQAGADEDESLTGDLDIRGNIRIVGSAKERTVVDAQSLDRVFDVAAGGSLYVEGITIQNGYVVDSNGGGIRNHGVLGIKNSEVSQNRVRDTELALSSVQTTFFGGGIYNTGEITIDQTVISYNTIENPIGWQVGSGGGLANLGTMQVSNSTISHSAANCGGAVFNQSTVHAEIHNTTIAHSFGDFGGGVCNNAGDGLTITNSTIAANYADEFGRAIANDSFGAQVSNVNIQNTIIAGNHGLDIWGTVNSLGYNLLESSNLGGLGDVVDSEASLFLSPLGNYGGPTPTFALLLGSPAIDVGSPAFAGLADQRGVRRDKDGNSDLVAGVDIGAFELAFGSIEGRRFADIDGDRVWDPTEPGLPHTEVLLDINGNGLRDPGEPVSETLEDDPTTSDFNEAGVYRFVELLPGEYEVHLTEQADWRRTISGPTGIARVSVSSRQVEGNGASGWTGLGSIKGVNSLSRDGRFVAFVSNATSLVAVDTNGFTDVYLRDRQRGTTERLSLAHDGSEPDGHSSSVSVNGDGRYIAFVSSATNLVPGVTDGAPHLFVHDRQLRTTEVIDVANDGTLLGASSPSISADGLHVAFVASDQSFSGGHVYVRDRSTNTTELVTASANGVSRYASLSADGRFVAFESDASNLVETDNDGLPGVFLFDRDSKKIDHIAEVSNFSSIVEFTGPDVSGDGRFVAFTTGATDVVPGDTNGAMDVFVYDRTTKMIERIDPGLGGAQGNRVSGDVSISDDGRYLAFKSRATNLVLDDTTLWADVFVFDRQTGRVEQVNVADDGTRAQSESVGIPEISGDGQYVVFDSSARNLVPNDNNSFLDVFVNTTMAANDVLSHPVRLAAGDVAQEVDFGDSPAPGSIRGHVFHDLNSDGVRNVNEPPVEDWLIFLDQNSNGERDPEETFTRTDADGFYEFTALPALASYYVASNGDDNWQQTFPPASQGWRWVVPLDAGERAVGRDFGIVNLAAIAQSQQSLISGYVFADTGQDGDMDVGDEPLTQWEVYLDHNDDGVRDFDEPVTLTNDDGYYEFPGLGAGAWTVRTVLTGEVRLVSPLDNAFQETDYTTGGDSEPLAIASGNFDDEGPLDLTVANIASRNIKVWKNDGGVRLREPPDVLELGGVKGTILPRQIVVADLDNKFGDDLILPIQDKDEVWVFYRNSSSTFEASPTRYPAGDSPSSVIAEDVNLDGWADLIATNFSTDEYTVLKNDQNRQLVSIAQVTGGKSSTRLPNANPAKIVTGHFNDDAALDFAIVNAGINASEEDPAEGSLAVFRNQGDLQFSMTSETMLSGGPVTATAGQFDGTGSEEIAVVNFGVDNVSVLGKGAGDSFTIKSTVPAGAGPLDIVATDMHSDGLVDLVVANAGAQSISVIRNRGGGEFEDPKNHPVLNPWSDAAAIFLTAGHLDGDDTIDLATVNRKTNQLSLLTNILVDGARRVSVNGHDETTNIDFAVHVDGVPPTIDEIPNPLPIREDSGTQTITLTGITDGGTGAQPLRVRANSSDTSILGHPVVSHEQGQQSGTLTYAPVADESGNVVITVTVTDGGLDADLETVADNLTARQSFTVAVTPVNDPPSMITLSSAAVAENSAGASVGTLDASDPDRNDSHEFAVSDPRFEVLGRELKLKAGSSLDHELEPSVTLFITAIDAGGLWLSRSFSIDVLNVNDPPTEVLAIDENAVGAVVANLTVIDPDEGDQHTLAVSDSRFEVVDSVLKLKAGTALNHEQESQVMVEVTATDNGQPTQHRVESFTITVNDVNEPPTGISFSSVIALENVEGFVVGNVTVVDEDADSQQAYSLSVDDERFEIVDGSLKLKEHVFLSRASTESLTLSVNAGDTTEASFSIFETVDVSVAENALPWSNQEEERDTNGDGDISPIDALVVINLLNVPSSPVLTSSMKLPGTRPAEAPFYDVNVDGFATAIDALIVINFLNEQPANAEGESRYVVFPAVPSGRKIDSLRAPHGGRKYDNLAHPFAVERRAAPQVSRVRWRPTLLQRPGRVTHELDELIDIFASDVNASWYQQAYD